MEKLPFASGLPLGPEKRRTIDEIAAEMRRFQEERRAKRERRLGIRTRAPATDEEIERSRKLHARIIGESTDE